MKSDRAFSEARAAMCSVTSWALQKPPASCAAVKHLHWERFETSSNRGAIGKSWLVFWLLWYAISWVLQCWAPIAYFFTALLGKKNHLLWFMKHFSFLFHILAFAVFCFALSCMSWVKEAWNVYVKYSLLYPASLLLWHLLIWFPVKTQIHQLTSGRR